MSDSSTAKEAGSFTPIEAYRTQNGHIRLRMKGGGVLAEELSGSYTTLVQAQKSLRAYLERKDRENG